MEKCEVFREKLEGFARKHKFLFFNCRYTS